MIIIVIISLIAVTAFFVKAKYFGLDNNETGTPEQSNIENMASGITMYMTEYAGHGSSLQKSGSDTIAGRSCDKYTMDYTHPSAKYKYTYYIDKATGVGLKFTMDLTSAGEKMGYEYEATKFQTTGVTLPSYR